MELTWLQYYSFRHGELEAYGCSIELPLPLVQCPAVFVNGIWGIGQGQCLELLNDLRRHIEMLFDDRDGIDRAFGYSAIVGRVSANDQGLKGGGKVGTPNAIVGLGRGINVTQATRHGISLSEACVPKNRSRVPNCLPLPSYSEFMYIIDEIHYT